MRKLVALVALAASLVGCGGSAIEGSWRNNKGGVMTFRSGDSMTLTDTDGSDYSGKWREVGTGQVELTLGGLMGLGGLQVCSYQITNESGATILWVNGCPFADIYRKQ